MTIHGMAIPFLMPIRIVLADDHALVRQGFRALLAAQPDFAVMGEAGNGREALRLIRTLAPQVVLMDVTMPELNGLDADPGELERAIRAVARRRAASPRSAPVSAWIPSKLPD